MWWWLAALACNPACPLGEQVTVEGRVVRAHAVEGGLPLLVGLHGYGMNAARFDEAASLTCEADDSRAFGVALPNGVWGAWDVTDPRPDNWPQAGDLALLEALVDRWGEDGAALVGLSNGALMAHRAYCEAAPFDGFAMVLGTLEASVAASCAPEPKPVLLVLATEDPLVPYAGGEFLGWELLSAEDTLAEVLAHNGCEGGEQVQVIDLDPDDGLSVQVRQWSACDAPVTLMTVRGAGHTWPGAPPWPVFGATSTDVDLTGWLADWITRW